MNYWAVTVTNQPGSTGELVPVIAELEENARQIALDLTPGVLDTVESCEPITEARYVELTTPPTIPPAQP